MREQTSKINECYTTESILHNGTHTLLAPPLALRLAEKRNSAAHKTSRERPVTVVHQQALGQALRVFIAHSAKSAHLVPVRARRHGGLELGAVVGGG